jgi:catabolite regulation protein CreA
MHTSKLFILCSISLLLSACSLKPVSDTIQKPIKPYEIGSVDTAFQWIGPDHKIEI